MGRNFTLALDDETIRGARVLAARRGRSVSALLREEIRRLVNNDEAFRSARTAALRRLARGRSLGGGPLPPRETLYDREAVR
jgi:plasmid stability protein